MIRPLNTGAPSGIGKVDELPDLDLFRHVSVNKGKK